MYPENKAPTDSPIMDPLANRWSPKVFSGNAIPQDMILSLFEAARWAPSSYNEQPWRYVYATKEDGAAREAIESLLVESNGYAKEAYLLMVSFGKKTHARNGKENHYQLHDTGMANISLVLQANSMGLLAHQMGGFDKERANEVAGLSDDFIPASMIAVGYAPEIADVPEEYKEPKIRERHPVSEFAFRGKFSAD